MTKTQLLYYLAGMSDAAHTLDCDEYVTNIINGIHSKVDNELIEPREDYE